MWQGEQNKLMVVLVVSERQNKLMVILVVSEKQNKLMVILLLPEACRQRGYSSGAASS